MFTLRKNSSRLLFRFVHVLGVLGFCTFFPRTVATVLRLQTTAPIASEIVQIHDCTVSLPGRLEPLKVSLKFTAWAGRPVDLDIPVLYFFMNNQ